MKTTRLLLAIFVPVVLIGFVTKADATIVLSEDFEDFAAGTGVHSLGEYGWQGVTDDGRQLTNSTVGPSRVIQSGFDGSDHRVIIGEGDSNNGGVQDFYFLWTDQVRPSLPESLTLTVFTAQFDNGEGYRMAFRLGSTWYLQTALIPETSGAVLTRTHNVSDFDFFQWTAAPANDTSTFNPTILAGAALPSGLINGFGLLINKSFGPENLQFDTLFLEGQVPEPSTGLLLGFGLFGMVMRRGGGFRVECGGRRARASNGV